MKTEPKPQGTPDMVAELATLRAENDQPGRAQQAGYHGVNEE